MKRFFEGFVVLLLLSACKEHKNEPGEIKNRRPTTKVAQHIYRSGDSMLAAFKRKDWVTFVQYNHPNLVKRMGGTEAFASFINLQMKQIPEHAIKSISLGKILQIVKTAKDVQCVVEQNTKMELQGVSLDKTTYLIGESIDNGEHWTFFDASTKTALLPKDIKPDISSQIKIPLVSNRGNL
jgi:hypothetical protein